MALKLKKKIKKKNCPQCIILEIVLFSVSFISIYCAKKNQGNRKEICSSELVLTWFEDEQAVEC